MPRARLLSHHPELSKHQLQEDTNLIEFQNPREELGDLYLQFARLSEQQAPSGLVTINRRIYCSPRALRGQAGGRLRAPLQLTPWPCRAVGCWLLARGHPALSCPSQQAAGP